MEAELLVNAAPYETRVARVENGRVEELYIERVRGIRGNIYKGRVVRVVPGIQAAFVEIGLERAGFLYAGDILRPSAVEEEEEEELAPNGLPPITSLVEEGQELLVQVAREPIGGKGPRLTTQIGLPGRYLVLLPNNPRIAIAKRLEDAEEIARLRAIAEAIRPENHGLIVRTVAHGRSEEELKRDLAFLLRIWGDIAQRARHAVPGSLLYKDLDLPLKVMRDYVDDRVVRIHVDSRETYERMLRFAERFMPEVKSRIFYYPGERPIFSLYGVEEEIARALLPRVPLRSGGCLVIEQTEALVAIDVNSGTKSATKNLEETGFKTNLEAVQEIVHQIRLRNL
ncbi:MAG: Rne/Rng family ribonuclease, partial [Zetaproteobacteria bacterium]